MGDCIHTPGLLDQAVDLFLHGYGGTCEQLIRLACGLLVSDKQFDGDQCQ